MMRLGKGKHLATFLAVACLLPLHVLRGQDDGLTKEASWSVPTMDVVRQRFDQWLVRIDATEETRDQVEQRLARSFNADQKQDRLEDILLAIEAARPEIANFVERARIPRVALEKPDYSSILNNKDEAPLVEQHVRLLYARWLAQNQLLDESLKQFDKIELAKCLDPATLLFYKGLAQHQLLKKDECVETLEKLLENRESLPRRFVIVGQLMVKDIEPLEADSLDEVSRIMKDIRRRQALYRSGTRVRQQEEEVIKKLDKLIEKIEQQQAAAAAQAQNQQGQMQPSSPMQDSQNASGKGAGEVVGKQQIEGGNWGSLPPAERAAAMAEMSKDLPPHYRAVIEEYFRQLASGDDE